MGDSTRPGRAGGRISPTVVSPIGASPATFEAPEDGTLWVFNGTVSNISVGGVQIAAGTGAMGVTVPVVAGDVVTVTYSSAPTLRFRPH